jgi:hypothetical protein
VLPAIANSMEVVAEEKVSLLTRQDTQHKRRVLHARDPRCHWCGVVTIDPAKTTDYQRPDLATLDHIKNRLQCSSAKEYRSGNNHVLACQKCNQERDREFHLTEQPHLSAPYKHRHSRRTWIPREDCTEMVMRKPSWETMGA